MEAAAELQAASNSLIHAANLIHHAATSMKAAANFYYQAPDASAEASAQHHNAASSYLFVQPTEIEQQPALLHTAE